MWNTREYACFTCVIGTSHVKRRVKHIYSHMWNFPCEIVKFHVWITCEISHMTFHMWNFTCDSHVKFHMWNFTCGNTYHMWKSHVKFHMWLSHVTFTCDFHMWNCTCENSHVTVFHMWNFTCEISHVKQSHGKFHVIFHVTLHTRNTCETHVDSTCVSHVKIIPYETHGIWDSHVFLELHMCESHASHMRNFCKAGSAMYFDVF